MRKRGVSILAKFFEKENIPIFFWEYSKRCGKTSLKVSETIMKKYKVVFEIWEKKKSCPTIPSIRSHPSHPSIQVGWTPGTPWREIRRLEHSTCKTRHSTCKTRNSTCKTRHSTCEASHSMCMSSTVRARLGYTLKGL